MNIKYGFLDKEKLDFYNTLDLRRKKYIDYRVTGYNKTEAYRMAGYNAKSKNTAQAAHNLEKGNVKIIIQDILNYRKLNEFAEGKGDLQRQINALTTSKQAEKALKVIENATGEEAIRIKFYQDISTGKTKTIEKTTIKDRDGNIKEERIVEKEPTVADRMQARKQLDVLLGLNDMPAELGSLQAGQITITIVDAANKKALEDKRNTVINADITEINENHESVGVDNE